MRWMNIISRTALYKFAWISFMLILYFGLFIKTRIFGAVNDVTPACRLRELYISYTYLYTICILHLARGIKRLHLYDTLSGIL